MFVDDNKIYSDVTIKEDIAKLQNDLDAAARWTSAWQLPLNVKKCQWLHLGHHNTKNQNLIGDVPIEADKEERDLGVAVDDKLTFHSQTGVVTKRANVILAVIKKPFDCLDIKTLPILYKTLVRPIIEYENSVWSLTYIED